jgi:hypothetical protein
MLVLAIAGLAAAILLSSAGPLATAEVSDFAEHGTYGGTDQLVPAYLSGPSTLHAVILAAGDSTIRPIGSCRT